LINKNFLICLTGLPASGKSTFANKLKEIIEKKLNKYKVKIIDPDRIRESINPREFDPSKEEIVRKKNLEEIKKSLEEGYIVISDDLNYYTSMRHDLKEIAENLDLSYFIIYISTPINICIKWNEKRGKPIPNEVIREVDKKFDNFSRYNWDDPIVNYDLSKKLDLNQKIEEIFYIFNQKIKKSQIIKEKKKKNTHPQTKYKERLDIFTRKVVSEILQTISDDNIKKELIKLRKIFVKNNLKKSIEEREIMAIFKKYLEKRLNFKIT